MSEKYDEAEPLSPVSEFGVVNESDDDGNMDNTYESCNRSVTGSEESDFDVKEESEEDIEGGIENLTEDEAVSDNDGNSSDRQDEAETPRLRIVERGLNFVRKDFGEEAGGTFYGLITSYDDPFFKVAYEDGDCEELEAAEVEEILVARDDVPPDILASLKGIAYEISAAGASDDSNVDEVDVDACLPAVDEWNTFVSKAFDGVIFCGLVMSYDAPFYKVAYEDGDHEDMEIAEVRQLLVPASTVKDDTKKRLRGFAVSMTENASPSGFESNHDKVVVQEEEAEKEVYTSPKKSSGEKKRGRSGGGGGAGGASKKARGKAAGTEDGDPNVVPSRVTPAGAKAWKYFVLKSFGELGDFYGLVISYDKPYYKVVYEDEDSEDLQSSQVRALLVPVVSVDADKQASLWEFAKAATGRDPSLPAAASSAPSTDDGNDTGGSEKKKGQGRPSGSKARTKKPKSSATSSPLAARTPASSKGSVSSRKPRLLEPVDKNENYVSKKFFGFGEFYGLIVSSQSPYFTVLYSDGDSEDMTRAEVMANLTDPSIIPNKVKESLRSRSSFLQEDDKPAAAVNSYRHVPEDNVYQQYVGRSFIDTDENIRFRVMSVCLHKDYDVLLFKYYDEFKFLGNPDYFSDQDKFEYSACSEMLKEDSWCKWLVEQRPDNERENDDRNVEKGDDDTSELGVVDETNNELTNGGERGPEEGLKPAILEQSQSQDDSGEDGRGDSEPESEDIEL